MPSHRAGAFKQANKKHSTGRHRSKGAIDSDNRGKKNDISMKKGHGINKLSKAQRRNQLVQKRKIKTKVVGEVKEALLGEQAPPICTTIISFDEEHIAAAAVLRCFMGCADDVVLTSTEQGHHYVSIPRLKMRFCFLTPSADEDRFAVLDAIKVSDSVLIVWPLEDELSEHKQHLLSCIMAQGVPLVLPVVRGLCTLSNKQAQQTRKNVQRELQANSLDSKFSTVDSDGEAMNVLRRLAGAKRQPTNLQRHHAHLLVDDIQQVDSPAPSPLSPDTCSVQMTGYVRGKSLDVNSLLHVPGWGTYQMAQIEMMHKQKHGNKEDTSMSEWSVLCQADVSQQSTLQTLVEADHMAGEQTWPTEDELNNAQNDRKQRKRVPEGTSEYQAAWIPDEPESDVDDDDDSDQDMDDKERGVEVKDSDSEDAADNMDTMSVAPSDFDAIADEVVDLEQLAAYREQRENELFPDEIDTPIDQPARVRFQKYRGLKSLRTSPWDPKENLPVDYSRIFQFENFKRSRKRALNEQITGAKPGWYVRVTLLDVPKALLEQCASQVLTVYGLLRHEQRLAVVNVTVSACALQPNAVPLKSKQPVMVQIGCRRLMVRPIYSEHTHGDKHKFERWMPAEGTCVATFYAPITYPPATVLLMSPDTGALLGTGSVLDVNAERVVLKRILLSGHPYRVHSKSVVVRYMFFTPEDVAWFKPVELRTKYGRRGHIAESMGTHGLMKVRLDGKVTQQDTVLMHLYKRMFPKIDMPLLSAATSTIGTK